MESPKAGFGIEAEGYWVCEGKPVEKFIFCLTRMVIYFIVLYV